MSKQRSWCCLVAVGALALSGCSLSAQAQQPSDTARTAQPPINITVTAPPQRPEDLERERNIQDRQVRANEDIRDFTYWLTVLAVSQAFITGLGLIAAFIAANAARKSANLAAEALYITERADVVIDRIEAPTIEDQLFGDTRVTVWFKNRGRTRAEDVIFDGTLGVPGGTPMPKDQAPPVIIAAGDEAPFGFKHELKDHIPGAVIDQINAGTLALQITGTLTYRDIFKRPHEIRFEGKWLPHRAAFGVDKYDNT